jgi:uncharacterized protein
MRAELGRAPPFSSVVAANGHGISDGFALAEFHYLGALLFRRSLAAILEDWVGREECSAADADRIAELLGRANAHRIYPIGDG